MRQTILRRQIEISRLYLYYAWEYLCVDPDIQSSNARARYVLELKYEWSVRHDSGANQVVVVTGK